MTTRPVYALMGEIIRNTIIITSVLTLAVALFGWTRGWETFFDFGGGLVLAGMGVLVLGIFSASHSWRSTQIYHKTEDEEATDSEMPEDAAPAASWLEELVHTFRVQLHFLLVGIIAIVFGSIIQVFTQ